MFSLPDCLAFVSNSLSELETDIKVLKDALEKILDEDELIEELCLTKWTDPRVLYVTTTAVVLSPLQYKFKKKRERDCHLFSV